MTVILEVKDVVTRFRMSEKTVHAVNGVSFSLYEREILCAVGESGCAQDLNVLSQSRATSLPSLEHVLRFKKFFYGYTCLLQNRR